MSGTQFMRQAMNTMLNMNRAISVLMALLIIGNTASASDSIPSGFARPLQWHIETQVSPALVPGTNGFLQGDNPEGKKISSSFSGDIRADFRFAPTTQEGILYRGLYQGIGLSINTFFANTMLGTPVSAYLYQGAPILHFSNRLWLGYEWQFGAAFGWEHYDQEISDKNAVTSTTVTAHMGLGFKLHCRLSDRWQMSMGLMAKHYSNGNTSWPNAGVNSIGATLGLTYIINPLQEKSNLSPNIIEEADKGKWFYDITLYWAWRKRVVFVGNPEEPQLCPGKFAIAGLQFSPLRSLNRWVAIGPSLDMQWDESAGLSPYWVEGTHEDMIKFRRPPFSKQISVGLSAHAELTMPIFSVNAGIGYDIINPKGNKAFYQSLTLKAFICNNIYLNTGYRLGSFKDPQNLMLGIGVRL